MLWLDKIKERRKWDIPSDIDPQIKRDLDTLITKVERLVDHEALAKTIAEISVHSAQDIKVVLARILDYEKIWYENKQLRDEFNRINTPEIKDFLKAVGLEAKHQRLRWESDHDAGKADADWFWLLGYLAGKAISAQTQEKKLHHVITTAAACLNWHAALMGTHVDMRPGIEGAKK